MIMFNKTCEIPDNTPVAYPWYAIILFELEQDNSTDGQSMYAFYKQIIALVYVPFRNDSL